eukprot:COSAG03_NODE_8310_length_815_cov_0.642458_1_plen_22_part_10
MLGGNLAGKASASGGNGPFTNQ